MPRPQFSIRTLLWLALVVAAFLGGIMFEKDRFRRSDRYYDQVRRPRRSKIVVLYDPITGVSTELPFRLP